MTDRVGQQLGNYRLTRLLGEGGFAEVYLGEHIHLGSQAAIKVLHSQLTSDDVDKFLLEARNLVRLIHPNIVRVLDFGIEEKTPFLVMDYAPNGTLRQLHPKGVALSLTTVVSYVKQIADGLQFAHDEKLIHRDIKPENMLIGRRNEILLSDFGIAIVAQSSRYQSTQDLAGTIAYMAPEQIQAHPRPASDQYSLGVVVYEWLTGDRPFHGGFSEIAIKHTIVPPPPLRERIPTISPDVEQVVLTALAKDPKDRFGSVQAFARALEQASLSDQQPQLAPTIVVNPPASVVQAEPHATPSSPQITPVTPLVPATQLAGASKPVGAILHTYRAHTDMVNAVAWSSDSTHIVSGSRDKSVRVWNVATGRNTVTYQGHTGFGASVQAVTWSPDGTHIASGSHDKTIQIWKASTGIHNVSLRSSSDRINALAWSPDGNRIASGSEDQRIYIWDIFTRSIVFTYHGHSWSVKSIAWSLDGRYIVSGSEDKTVQVWNATNGNHLRTYRVDSGTVNAVVWSPNANYIAFGGDDRMVHICTATAKRHILAYNRHSNRVLAVSWSPNGKYIASSSVDRTVQIWNAADGKNIYTFRGHSGVVTTVSWSPNGKYIASGSEDKTVQVWVAP